MIVRRDHQLAFQRSASERFESAAVEHLRKELTDRVAALSDNELTLGVRGAISRAKSFGVRTERQIMCFLDSEVLLGQRFYDAPEHAWAARMLNRPDLNPNDKFRALLKRSCHLFMTSNLAEDAANYV